MPRTKRSKKVALKVNDENEEKKSNVNKSKARFEAVLEEWKNVEKKLLQRYEDSLKIIELSYNMAKLKIPPSIGNKPPRDPLRHSFELAEAVSASATATQPQPPHGRSKEDEDQPQRLPPSSAMARFRTPNLHLGGTGTRYNVITPKVMPNVPISIVRRPQEGEMAFALSGSPLLVSNAGSSETPNVIVPLKDGRVMSILPQSGLRMSDMPAVDDSVLRQLMSLRDNLNVFFKN